MSVAVSMARRFGFEEVAVPSAGNAAGALAAYSAAAKMKAHVFMPRDTPKANIEECLFFGASVNLVDGLITDCAAAMRASNDAKHAFDMSTLREPYRVEGKKTMAYELFEALSKLPDVIIYPTGGGTGLIGMWKAFDEMQALGLVGSERPRMVSVQAAGCAPIVTAFEEGERFAAEAQKAHTIASGLRVPKALGDFIMLDLLRESQGAAVAVTDEEMLRCARKMAVRSGVNACPEGGATLGAAEILAALGFIREEDVVVLFNTASAAKYAEAFAT
jgi:threonine synthase